MSLRDAAGCCLDNILVVHYVCMVLVSVGENECERKVDIYINIATDLDCIEKNNVLILILFSVLVYHVIQYILK